MLFQYAFVILRLLMLIHMMMFWLENLIDNVWIDCTMYDCKHIDFDWKMVCWYNFTCIILIRSGLVIDGY